MKWKFSAISSQIKSMVVVSSGAVALYIGSSLYSGNEIFYNEYLMPLAHSINPERAHNFAVAAAKYGFVPKCNYKDTPTLKSTIWGLDFKNPVGMAAGFDKQGEAVQGLHKIGFGFVEIGSVTPLPQAGNEKPRVFRLHQDKAIINRYGFNSHGHDVVYERIKAVKSDRSFTGIIGINLGKNRESEDPVGDYVQGIKKFGEIADYLVINISSPNTPGLRSWHQKQLLQELLTQLVKTRDSLKCSKKPPLLLKLAPDLTLQERQDIAQIITEKKSRVDGLVISNTTVERYSNLTSKNVAEKGGLSGQPLCDRSTQLIYDMYKLTNGKIPIIGVGGVFTGQDAYEKILAGASLIQVYTSLIYHGPPVVGRIKKELDALIEANGFKSIAEAVGSR